MPSTPSSHGDFHDGFDEFFNIDDEYASPHGSRGESPLPGSDPGVTDDEPLPELDLSSLNLNPGDEIYESDGEYDEDEEGEYFDQESTNDDRHGYGDDEISWDEEDPLEWGEEDPLEDGPQDDVDEHHGDNGDASEGNTSDSTYSDDELDELLNFDDDSWMEEEEEGDSRPLEEDEGEEEIEDNSTSLHGEEFNDIDLRKPIDSWDEGSQGIWHGDEQEDDDADILLEKESEDMDEEDGGEAATDDEEGATAVGKKQGEAPWKSKFADFKRKAQAELQGKDSKEISHPSDDDAEDKEEADDSPPGDDDAEAEGSTPAPRSRAGLGNLALGGAVSRLLGTRPLRFLGRLLRPIKSAYLFIVNTILKALEWILGILGRIPVIGKPFAWLGGLTQVLRQIATCIPLVLLIVLIVHLNRSAVPPQADSSLPDSGHVAISAMSYDGDDKVAKGTLRNDGDIITKVQPTFTVYSSSLLNPISWAFPGERVSCIGPMVKLEAGESKEVQAKCSGNVGGMFKKTTARLSAE